MRKFLFILFFPCLLMQVLQAKELAITFDDSPRFANGNFYGPTRARTLIENLRKHNAGKVVFFSVSRKINKEGRLRLQQYADAGHIIANHTATHPNFNNVSLSAYKDNFVQADIELEGFDNFKRWFRFPFLKEGNTIAKRDGMRNILATRNYLNAYVTLNNYDWFIEKLFQDSVNSPNFDFDKMKKFYVNVLIESIEYYDEMALWP